MSASGAPPQSSPESVDGPPPRRWDLGRRRTKVGIAAAAAVAGLLLAAVVAVTQRDSTPALDEAGARTIASDVVKKAVEDLQSQPATSAVVYQQILPSLVEI